MLNLRRLILALHSNRDLDNALELKEFLLSNNNHLIESNITINFIESLCLLCEEFHAHSVENFYSISCDFYAYMLDIKPKDIYFFGSTTAYNEFTNQVTNADFNILFYNSEHTIDIGALNEKIYNSQLSVLAYDYHGSETVFNKGVYRPFSYFYYESPQKNTRMIYEDWKVFLTHQYKRFVEEEFDQVILGSSYAYHALTDINSVSSVSFSLPGLDITDAMRLYNEIHQISLSNSVIFCFALYDLFKETKYGKDAVFVNARKAVAAFMDAKVLTREQLIDESSNHTEFSDIANPVDIIISSRYFKHNTIKNKKHQLNDSDVIYNIQSAINKTTQISKDKGELLGAHAASQHNKLAKYKKSFELNCALVQSLKKNSEILGKDVFFIIPPLPESYVENVSESIKNDAYHFLKTLESQFFHVIDFSTDRDFCYADFSDGHHLNIFGAKKLRNKLFDAGILNNDEL